MAGIFGDTPAAVRQQMIAEQLGQANMIGNLGFGGRGALAGLQVGQGIGGILGAPEDPRLAQAQKMQQLEQEAAQAGLEPGTQEFTRWVVPRVTAVAGQQAGIQAFQMASELEAQRAELEGIRGAPQAAQAQTERRVRTLTAAGIPPQQAFDISQNDKAYEKIVTDRFKVEGKPLSLREFELSQIIPGYREHLVEQKRLGATTVSLNDFYKPQTQPAKLAADLAYLQSLPPSKETNEAITAIRRAQKAQGVGAEAQRSSDRMEAVDKMIGDFIKTAENNPGDVGPIAGRVTREKVERGFGSQTEAELTAMEAGMKAMLGTALSGAAIPESEWPTYQAMVPEAINSTPSMKGKAKIFRNLIQILDDIKNGKATREDLAKVTLSSKAMSYFGGQ